MDRKYVWICVVMLIVGLVVGAGIGYYLVPKSVEKHAAIGIEVGQVAPDFSLPSTLGREVSLGEFRGKWVVLFFYPAAYTPICKSEVEEFNRRLSDFSDLDTEVLGASVDDVNTLNKWAAEIGGIQYPLLSDVGGEVSQKYGSYTLSSKQDVIKGKSVSMRGTFVIDPEGITRYVLIHDELVGRSVDETLRVLEALQSEGACIVEWEPSRI
jgi:peroxiredoxin (alkyl hydroperoxide reductase subunit C)